MLRRLPVLLAISLLARVAGAGASVIYVDAAAPGPTHDGASWATAFADLQSALSAAGAAGELWVAAGTYAPTAGTDRTVSFALKNGVGVYGGFAGTETLRSQRDPAAHVTTLSGEIGAAGTADNSYHVVTADGTVTASAVLDGFTITAGHANGAATDQQRGGGMLVVGGGPTLSQLRFSSNYASDRGGGVRVESGAPAFSVCAFTSNSSGTAGGGLSSASATSLSVKRCAFTGNGTASTRGGGIDANSVAASDCLVAGNTGNGVYIAQDGATFVNCTIAGNSSYGAVFVGGPNSSVANSILSGDALGEISPFFFDANVTFSDVAGGHAGTGNIGSSPNFMNSGGGDYHLGSSPCADAGSNAAATGLTTDLDGLPRFFDDPLQIDTGAGTAPIVDMGAYERVPLSVSSPADKSVCAGASVSLSVTASGQATLSYRWRKGGSNLADGGAISGTGTDTLTIDPAATGDSGSYDVVVTDGFGQMKTSTAAALTVSAVPPAPVTTAPKSVVVGAASVAASVPDHSGSTYAWTLSGGTITSGQGTHQIAFSAGGPGATMTLTVVETGAGGCVSPESATKVQVDFTDVPPSYLFHNAVVTVARDGITTGCGAGKYCPDDPVTRDAMAVFILRGEHGASYNPPAATGNVFSDVTTGTFLAKWMEQFGNEGISTGCGAGSPPPYCPTAAVTRDGMAVFLLRGKHGASFNPAAATGAVFCDVATGTFLAKWMEALKAEGITSGCGGGACGKPNYCPGNTVSRGEMAAFIVKTFGLP